MDAAGPEPTLPPTVPVPDTTIPWGAADTDGDGFYEFAELQRAVGLLLPTYQFPPAYQVTEESLTSGFARYANADPPSRWEVGYEYTLVGLAHDCAWSRTWLDAYLNGDTALMDESLERLRAELDNPAYVDSRNDKSSFTIGPLSVTHRSCKAS